MTDQYDDIINLDRPRSGNHKPMPVEARAAQFAPFAALTGHEAAITETARLTSRRIELSPDETVLISRRLSHALARIAERPTLRVTYFRPDLRKTGGSYVSIAGPLVKYDEYTRQIKIGDTIIGIADIYSLALDDKKL